MAIIMMLMMMTSECMTSKITVLHLITGHHYNSMTLFIHYSSSSEVTKENYSNNKCTIGHRCLLINLSPLYASSISSACELISLCWCSRCIRSQTLPRSLRSRLREFLITLLLSFKRCTNDVTVLTSFLGLWIQ